MRYTVYESPKSGRKRSDRIPEGDKRNAYLREHGWRVVETIDTEAPAEVVPVEALTLESEHPLAFLSSAQRYALVDAGYGGDDELRAATDDELRAVDGIGPAAVRDIRKSLAGPQPEA